jgi:predicted PurR-regulated permease PerM
MDKEKKTENIKKHPITDTWFWKYVVDNKFVSILFITFLLVLTLFIFINISHIFEPLGLVLSIIGPPIVLAMLFYYLLKPIVDYLEGKGLSRNPAIWLVFAGIILAIALAIMFIIPGVQNQIERLVVDFPAIWNSVLSQLEELLATDWLTDFFEDIQETNILERVTEQFTNVFSVTIDSIGSLFGSIARVIITIFTFPFVLYYFLVDRTRFKQGVLKITPTRIRPTVSKFLFQASNQVGAYVRGQLLVALCVGIIFYIGYRIIGLDYALILSIAAGVLNLIPYLGSILASIPALIIGIFVSPWQFIQVILVIAVEQMIEGRIVSPLILGNRLDVHPLVILFILLVSGSLFGFMGLILAVPGYGVLRVIWNLFFEWLKNNYDYYDEIEEQEPED